MDNNGFFYYTIPVNKSVEGGKLRMTFKLTPPPKRSKRVVKVRRKLSDKDCYGVSFKGEPFAITYTHEGENVAISNVLHRKEKQLQKLGLSVKTARPLMTAVLLPDPDEWKGKIKQPKRKVKWQPLRNGEPIREGKQAIEAVSAAEATCHKWYGRYKSKEGPVTTEETKRIYHDEMTAKPVFGQVKPQAPRRRKVSHLDQPNLFPH